MLDDIKCNSWPVLAWRSGKSADLSCDRSRVRSRLRTSRFWSRVRVAFYKRMTGSLARTYTALAATHGTPSGEVASRCNPRHKGACNPQFLRPFSWWCAHFRFGDGVRRCCRKSPGRVRTLALMRTTRLPSGEAVRA